MTLGIYEGGVEKAEEGGYFLPPLSTGHGRNDLDVTENIGKGPVPQEYWPTARGRAGDHSPEQKLLGSWSSVRQGLGLLGDKAT